MRLQPCFRESQFHESCHFLIGDLLTNPSVEDKYIGSNLMMLCNLNVRSLVDSSPHESLCIYWTSLCKIIARERCRHSLELVLDICLFAFTAHSMRTNKHSNNGRREACSAGKASHLSRNHITNSGVPS